ncbi:MAG: flagellar motor switch protein FliN [Pseudomonadota bacterium]
MIDDTENNGTNGTSNTQMNELLSQIDGKGNSYENDANNKDVGTKNESSTKERPFIAKELEAVYDVPVQISAVLGRSTMPVHQLLKLGRGAVVELDRRVGEAIDIYVNNRLIARGEVVVVDDHLGVTMTEIIKSDRS